MLEIFSAKRGEKGFTLIELLVVIAIIGILATIVLVSLNTARQKARDTRRISDLRQVALALEMYYDDNGGYPADVIANDDDWAVLDTELEASPIYMTSVPTDPTNSGSYVYKYHPNGTTANGATDYVLGATLENTSHSALGDSFGDTANGLDCSVAGLFCIMP